MKKNDDCFDSIVYVYSSNVCGGVKITHLQSSLTHLFYCIFMILLFRFVDSMCPNDQKQRLQFDESDVEDDVEFGAHHHHGNNYAYQNDVARMQWDNSGTRLPHLSPSSSTSNFMQPSHLKISLVKTSDTNRHAHHHVDNNKHINHRIIDPYDLSTHHQEYVYPSTDSSMMNIPTTSSPMNVQRYEKKVNSPKSMQFEQGPKMLGGSPYTSMAHPSVKIYFHHTSSSPLQEKSLMMDTTLSSLDDSKLIANINTRLKIPHPQSLPHPKMASKKPKLRILSSSFSSKGSKSRLQQPKMNVIPSSTHMVEYKENVNMLQDDTHPSSIDHADHNGLHQSPIQSMSTSLLPSTRDQPRSLPLQSSQSPKKIVIKSHSPLATTKMKRESSTSKMNLKSKKRRMNGDDDVLHVGDEKTISTDKKVIVDNKAIVGHEKAIVGDENVILAHDEMISTDEKFTLDDDKVIPSDDLATCILTQLKSTSPLPVSFSLPITSNSSNNSNLKTKRRVKRSRRLASFVKQALQYDSVVQYQGEEKFAKEEKSFAPSKEQSSTWNPLTPDSCEFDDTLNQHIFNPDEMLRSSSPHTTSSTDDDHESSTSIKDYNHSLMLNDGSSTTLTPHPTTHHHDLIPVSNSFSSSPPPLTSTYQTTFSPAKRIFIRRFVNTPHASHSNTHTLHQPKPKKMNPKCVDIVVNHDHHSSMMDIQPSLPRSNRLNSHTSLLDKDKLSDTHDDDDSMNNINNDTTHLMNDHHCFSNESIPHSLSMNEQNTSMTEIQPIAHFRPKRSLKKYHDQYVEAYDSDDHYFVKSKPKKKARKTRKYYEEE